MKEYLAISGGGGRVSLARRLRTVFCAALVAVVALPVSAAEATRRWMMPCGSDVRATFRAEFEGRLQIGGESPNGAMLVADTSDGCATAGEDASRTRVRFGGARMYYESGSMAERWARPKPERDNPSNQVLEFGLKGHNAGVAKGRVQLNIFGNKGLKVITAKVRMRLGPGFAALRDAPKGFDWLALSSWWNNDVSGESPYPLVISVDLNKKSGVGTDRGLYFVVRARTYDQALRKWDYPLWRVENEAFQVPVGEWLLLEYILIEGGASTGRFVLKATLADGISRTIFDVSGFTHHPSDPSPDGFSGLSPIKLYTSAALIAAATAASGSLTVEWDSMELAGCFSPDACTYVRP